MTDKMKLLLALTQVENIAKLVEGNQWEGFFTNQLIPIKYEIQRQLSCIDGRKTIV